MAVPRQENLVIFRYEHINFVMRLIEGRYPLYRKVIPLTCATYVVMETRSFAAAIERVLPFTSGTLKAGRITVGTGMLTVEASDPDLGSHVSQLEARVTGPGLQMFFPMRFLLDALSRIETSEVAFSICEQRGIIKPVSETQQYIQLVMAASAEAA
jgi:DNA polymerase-3 subunit beta